MGLKLLYGVNDGAKKQRQVARGGSPRGATPSRGSEPDVAWTLRAGAGVMSRDQLANLHFFVSAFNRERHSFFSHLI